MMCFMKEIYFIISFLHLLMAFDYATKRLEVRFCGFEQSCSVNITRQVLRKDACCRPCECDDECVEKGTCCREERVLNDIGIDIKQDCLPSVYTPDDVPVPANSLSYFTRTSCPKPFYDKTVKIKCEKDRPETITDIRPVSSLDGKFIYKNIHCSHCHGELNTHSWGVIVHKGSPPNCRKILRYGSLDINTITQEILLNCILVFIPPTNINIWNVLCFDEITVIKKCNITGKWEMFDKEVNNFCLTQTDTGYYIFRDLGRVYNNIYCAMCNGFSYFSIDTCWNTLERFPHYTMFALLNVGKLLGYDLSTEKARCANGEIYDTYFNKCRTLYCLWNAISYQGDCVPFLDYENKMGYQLRVKLVPTKRGKQIEFMKNDLRNHYILVQKILGFEKCELCHFRAFAKNITNETTLPEMYVSFVFTPTTRCTIETIWSKFMEVETKLPMYLNLTMHDDLIVFQAFWANLNYVPLDSWNIVLETTLKCHTFVPGLGQICPKVKLLKHEVETVMKYHPKSEELTWVQNEEDRNGSAFVCSNKYITHQRSVSQMKDLSNYLSIVIIIPMFISMSLMK